MTAILAIFLGFLLDCMFGDPHWLPHPVRWMGKAISLLEGWLRKGFPATEIGERIAGTLLWLVVAGGSFAITMGVLLVCGQVSPWLRFALEVLICYQTLAARSLMVESMKVYPPLSSGDLTEARRAVSMIVGRDTENLTGEQVAKAAVETVAENTSDGLIAPLFYLVLGGIFGMAAPMGIFYKAVNTMDSMLGYKNSRYLYFGRTAAKMDDLFNFLPARLSGLLMIGSAFLLGMDGKNAWRIFRRDRLKHASPNSAQTESACAGALRIQLAGDAYYFGRLVQKPTIGDPLRPVEYEDIRRANRLMYLTAVLGLLLLSLCGGGIIALLGI